MIQLWTVEVIRKSAKEWITGKVFLSQQKKMGKNSMNPTPPLTFFFFHLKMVLCQDVTPRAVVLILQMGMMVAKWNKELN